MTKPSPHLALGLGIAIVGVAAILIRQADAPGTMSAFYRLAIGTAVLTPFYLARARRRVAGPRPVGVRWAVLGGFFFALDMAFWSTGIVWSGAAIPTLLVNTAPLWVGLGAMLLLRERLAGAFWAGLAVALTGAAVILAGDLVPSRAVEWGGVFGLVAAVFYAGFHLASQRGRETLHTLDYLWISSLSATLTLFAACVMLGYDFFGHGTATVLNFVAQGVLVQVGGWAFLNYAQGYLPASVVAPSLLGQPVVTALVAWVLLGEPLTVLQMAGGVLVLAGLVIVHRTRRAAR